MKTLKYSLSMSIAALGLSGCALFPYGAYTNELAGQPPPGQPEAQASFAPRAQRVAKNCAGAAAASPKRQDKALLLLALSGGGSRAAYFSALSMLEMQKIKLRIGDADSDVLHEVDVISSVSGGSLAGAYYAISHDPGAECAGYAGRAWNADDDAEIRDLMTRDYRNRWIGNWFWPTNIAAFWLSNYDRTDIMAQTLADNLFDRKTTGIDLTLGELNPLRPNLVLNATTGSRGEGNDITFGQVFTFTKEDFERICSPIQSYSVARAVMSTATFPGVFNFMTLRDFCWKKGADNAKDARYLHVFDGGNGDNLGLTSLKRVIWHALADRDARPTLSPYKKVIVIQVDAHIDPRGADPGESDPRGAFDFILDTNFIDATDSLLEANRARLLAELEARKLFPFGTQAGVQKNDACTKFFHGDDIRKYCDKPDAYWEGINKVVGDALTFVHVGFDRIGEVSGCVDKQGKHESGSCLREQLGRIATDFKLKSKRNPATGLTDAEAIACAVPALFGRADFKHCGELRPAPSAPLAKQWEAVKAILQDPDAATAADQGSTRQAPRR
jgi:predicted acylesterase/phospholipase RssA